MTHHTLDTNIIINLKNFYARDVFGAVWDKVESAIANGELCICTMIHDELHRGGDDLYEWAKNQPGFVCDMTGDEAQLASHISNDHPGWVQQQQNAGDPFIVAHASIEGSDLVTNETRKGAGTIDKNMKVPNVADEHNVTSMNFLDFLRAKGWRF